MGKFTFYFLKSGRALLETLKEGMYNKSRGRERGRSWIIWVCQHRGEKVGQCGRRKEEEVEVQREGKFKSPIQLCWTLSSCVCVLSFLPLLLLLWCSLHSSLLTVNDCPVLDHSRCLWLLWPTTTKKVLLALSDLQKTICSIISAFTALFITQLQWFVKIAGV